MLNSKSQQMVIHTFTLPIPKDLIEFYHSLLYELTPLILNIARYPLSTEGINKAIIRLDDKYVVVSREINKDETKTFFNIFNKFDDSSLVFKVQDVSILSSDHRLYIINSTSIFISSTINYYPSIGSRVLTRISDNVFKLSELNMMHVIENPHKVANNWGVFRNNGNFYFIDKVSPLNVIKAFDFPFPNLKNIDVITDVRSRNVMHMNGSNVIRLPAFSCDDDNLYDLFELRGGTPAIYVNGEYLAFGHGKILNKFSKEITSQLTPSSLFYSVYAYIFISNKVDDFTLTRKSPWPISFPHFPDVSR